LKKAKKNSDYQSVHILTQLFSASALLLATIVIIAGLAMPRESEEVIYSDIEYRGGFVWVNNGNISEIDIGSYSEVAPGEVFVVETVLPDAIYQGNTFCLELNHQSANFYVKTQNKYGNEEQGRLIYTYDTTGAWYGGNTSASGYVMLPMVKDYSGKVLRIEITSESSRSGSLGEVYYGNSTKIWLYLLRDRAPGFVLSIVLVVAGIVFVIFCYVLRVVVTKRSLSLVYLGWCSLTVGVYMLTESRFRQLIFRNFSLASWLPYLLMFIFAGTMLLYINEIQEFRYNTFYVLSHIQIVVSSIALIIMHLTGTKDLFQNVLWVYIFSLMPGITIAWTLIRDIVKKHLSNYSYTMAGFVVLLLSVLVEIAADSTGVNVNAGLFLGSGVLIFVFLASYNSAKVLLKSEEAKRKIVAEGEAKAQFLANMSHEIRTPLNTILGMNQMILRDSSDKDISEYAENIEKSGSLLLSIINDILDFSKISAGKLEIVNTSYSLSKVIKDINNSFAVKAADKGLSFEINAAEDACEHLYGDEIRIRQIIINIVNNAIKYTEKGSVTVSFDQEIQPEGQYLLIIRVKDTGKGIRERDMDKLFTAFRRLDQYNNTGVEGTGLGLSITHSLVTLMDGEIIVDSVYGEGSTFEVRLPQRPESEEKIGRLDERLKEVSTEKPKYVPSFTASKGKLLVVDDTKTNLTIIKLLLRETKMNITLAPSGREALSLLKQENFDLVLLDHMMPEMDGVETLRHINEMYENRPFPVIALTANALSGAKERYINLGFDDYLSKPVDTKELEELLLRWLPKEILD